ncbi:unnamed protein product [Miscanthus lutarioriparius]|uniref:NB-ARC domain-containing protein n=1 Tax=Miscanthus lutarioriparius TaxID=422564 RepID=A0A811QHA5_9POAL|nr:unnamed protein product [Miscanthus lutarioriparius]
MAEAVVGVLIGKLGAALAKEAATYGASLLCKEASALKGLFGEIRKAEKEFESMKTYLRQAEKFKDTDETTGIFTKNISQDEEEDQASQAAWVTVSKSYQFEDMLKRIAREFSIVTDATNMEIRGLVEIIRKHLEGKSRFVLTSRKFEVASLATSNCRIELEPLGDKHSWELFCKAAFRNSDDERCPSELQDLAVKFLQKCEGLPIAIACIGRLLSVKQPTYSEWDSVYMELELQSNNNVIQGVDSILKVSLEDLPHELKNCFLHCAIFPEDYKLGRRRLIRHWITSGFIKEKENNTLEQVAEGYLNDLVNRSLLQVVMKNEFGRLRCCRMHDIIRHFALDKAAKECFCTVYEGHGTFSVHETRRLSINSTNIVPLNQSGVMQLRAIYVFTSFVDIDLLRPILASSTLLSTLDLQGTKIKMLPNEVFSLFNLRFLGLRYTGIETLPEAVGRLQNLERQLEKKRMPELLSSWLHLNYLTCLSLAFSKLDENSFPNLMVLRNLCSLNLNKAYEGKTLCFSVQSFPRLRELYIWDAPQLSQVEIEEDALGCLVKLWFAGCPELKRLPRGIEYLTTLDELYLEDAADELIKIIRQEGEANECKEELMKISHIRMVDFKSTEKNFWQRIVNREGNAFAG